MKIKETEELIRWVIEKIKEGGKDEEWHKRLLNRLSEDLDNLSKVN